MNWKLNLTLILFSALTFLASCEFKPEGEYYRDLQPVPPDSVSVIIQGYSDTLIITHHTFFEVKVQCNDRRLVFYRMFIDGVLKEERGVYGSGFNINPLQYIDHDQVYRLSLEVGISSGSGSIADKLGAEGYTYIKDFVFTVFLNQASFYPNLKTDRSGGRMRLYVDVPPSIQNIRKMVFYKTVEDSNPVAFASVVGSGHFEAIDSNYTGEYAYYRVDVYLGDPTATIFTLYAHGGCHADMDAPEITVTPSEQGYPLLRWRRTHYPGNAGSYRIYCRGSENYTVQLLGTNANINDTVFEAAGTIFPAYYVFHVAAIPHQPPSYLTDQVAWDAYSDGVTSYVGKPSFYFTSCRIPESRFIYYGSGFGEISEYCTDQDTVTHLFTGQGNSFYTYSVSPNGKYLLASTGSYNLQYLLVDLTTYQEQWIPGSQVVGSGNDAGIISISDYGVAAISCENRLVVYDFINQAAVTEKTFTSNVSRTVISANGQFIFAESGKLYLYQLVSSNLDEKWNSSGTSGTIKYYTFYPGSPGLAALFIDQTFSTRNCSNWGLVSSYQVDFTDLSNIDFTAGRILGLKDETIKVYGLYNGNLLFQNPVIEYSTAGNFRIKSNTIYHNSGKKLTIF